MSPLERYRQLYQYEIDANHKMLTMLASVPEASHSEARFQQAVNIAAHIAACRENWLSYMRGAGEQKSEWFEQSCDLATLETRYAALEADWTEYLANLTEAQQQGMFEFMDNGDRWSVPTELQILQLALHAPYHRGQIALLVDQLGGETVDTDYIDWILTQT